MFLAPHPVMSSTHPTAWRYDGGDIAFIAICGILVSFMVPGVGQCESAICDSHKLKQGPIMPP